MDPTNRVRARSRGRATFGSRRIDEGQGRTPGRIEELDKGYFDMAGARKTHVSDDVAGSMTHE